MIVSNRDCFPENDIYFCLGIAALKSEMQKKGLSCDYTFIHLTRHTLAQVLQKLPEVQGKIVIVASPMLVPVALCWQVKTNNITAVLDATSSVPGIIRALTQRTCALWTDD